MEKLFALRKVAGTSMKSVALFKWMNERHAIYLRRHAGADWPWTRDPILKEYKFTNVYRELDAGTLWCKDNIREPYADHPELFVNIAMYRRYNWIDTAIELGYMETWDKDALLSKMLARRARGDKVFTGAHMLCGNIKDDNGWQPPEKVTQVFGIAFDKLWTKRKEIEPQPGDTLQSAFERFMAAKIPGYGAFIVYEVISDLRWTRYLSHASDILSWANPGPGAKRGIQRVYGMSPITDKAYFHSFKTGDYIDVMRWLLDRSPKYLASYMVPLEMRDIEHSLCEWDKYMRVYNGEGHPRAKFTPPQHRKQV